MITFSGPSIPVYNIEPDAILKSADFRMYQYAGNQPDRSELLVPHRKSHYLLVFIRRAGNIRQWLDTAPVRMKDNTIYFLGPHNVIVKEESSRLWSTGVAFTQKFLSMQANASMVDLPIILNPYAAHELLLDSSDIAFVEDMLDKLQTEYERTSDWRHRMLGAHLAVLLTYLSRLYTEQFRVHESPSEKELLRRFQACISENYRDMHEVSAYARLLHVSAGHLSEIIKVQSGKPAIKHIHDRLVLEARRLLFHTPDPLKDIAFELGFGDASYFNRFFKRETGMTPREYRISIRKMYH